MLYINQFVYSMFGTYCGDIVGDELCSDCERWVCYASISHINLCAL